MENFVIAASVLLFAGMAVHDVLRPARKFVDIPHWRTRGLSFFVLLPLMKRTETITLDIDWIWRRFIPKFWHDVATPILGQVKTARDAVMEWFPGRGMSESDLPPTLRRRMPGTWAVSVPVLPLPWSTKSHGPATSGTNWNRSPSFNSPLSKAAPPTGSSPELVRPRPLAPEPLRR